MSDHTTTSPSSGITDSHFFFNEGVHMVHVVSAQTIAFSPTTPTAASASHGAVV